MRRRRRKIGHRSHASTNTRPTARTGVSAEAAVEYTIEAFALGIRSRATCTATIVV